jgi:hypothetical protein
VDGKIKLKDVSCDATEGGTWVESVCKYCADEDLWDQEG